MKNCNGCEFANWKRTKAGRLHPSGVGHCTYQVPEPELPASMYWVSKRFLCGGSINRRKTFEKDCPTYKESAK